MSGGCAKCSVVQGGMLASDETCIVPPGMAANPARGGPKGKIELALPPFAPENLVFVRRVRPPRPAPARSFSASV